MMDENQPFQVSPRGKSKLQENFGLSRSKDEHITVEWTNINYSVITNDSKKGSKSGKKNNRILRDVSGRAESGQLLAIMGPTGCGKTSLLNVLAARVGSGGMNATKLTGTILVNGAPRKDEGTTTVNPTPFLMYLHSSTLTKSLTHYEDFRHTNTPLD